MERSRISRAAKGDPQDSAAESKSMPVNLVLPLRERERGPRRISGARSDSAITRSDSNDRFRGRKARAARSRSAKAVRALEGDSNFGGPKRVSLPPEKSI